MNGKRPGLDKGITLTTRNIEHIEAGLDEYAHYVREWWTRSEVVLSNARLGIFVER